MKLIFSRLPREAEGLYFFYSLYKGGLVCQ